jgi:hypothetical protein
MQEERTVSELQLIALQAASQFSEIWKTEDWWPTEDLKCDIVKSINSALSAKIKEFIHERIGDVVEQRALEIANKCVSQWLKDAEFFNDPPSPEVVAAIKREVQTYELDTADYLSAAKQTRFEVYKMSMAGESIEGIAEHFSCKVSAIKTMLRKAKQEADRAKYDYQLYHGQIAKPEGGDV